MAGHVLPEVKRRGVRYAIVTMCIGGGRRPPGGFRFIDMGGALLAKLFNGDET
jgi:hypothetical protein